MSREFRFGFIIEGNSEKGTKALRRTKTEVDKLDQSTDKARKGTDKYRSSLQSQNKSLGRAKTMLIGFAGAAALGGIGAILFSVTKNTKEFEAAISNLSAITGATGDDLAFLSEQARDIGRSTTLSASEAVTAFKLIASAKPDLLESGEALNSVTRSAVTLAEAARIDLPAAANALGSALNQFGADADQANRFINVLAAGSLLGSSAIDQTTDALRKSGAAANALGLSFEETNAAIQVLAKGAIVGSEAGTGLRNVLLALEQEADQGLRPSIVGASTAIENLAAKGLDAIGMLDLFGKENLVAGQILVDNAALLGKLEEAMTGTNTAIEQADTNNDNWTADLEKQASALQELTLVLGLGMTPSLRDFTQGSTEAINSLAKWLDDGGIEDVKLALEAISVVMVARLAPAMAASSASFVRATASSISYQLTLARMAGVSTAAAIGTTGLTAATTALGGAMKLVGGPIGIVIIAVGALALGYRELKKTQENAISGAVANSVAQGFQVVELHILGTKNSIDDLNAEYDELEQASILNVAAMLRQREVSAELRTQTEILSQLESERTRLIGEQESATGELSLTTGELSEEMQALQDELTGGSAALGEATTATIQLDEDTEELIDKLRGELMQLRMTGLGLELFTALSGLSEEATADQKAEVVRLTEELFNQELQIKATEEAAKETADAQTMLNALDLDIRKLGMTERAIALMNAEMEVGQTVSEEMRQKIIDRTAALFDQETQIKETAIADKDAAAAAEQNLKDVAAENKRAAKLMAEDWRDTRDAFADFFVEFSENGEDAFEALADSFESSLKRMAAQWLASGIMNLFGFSGGGTGGSLFNFGGGGGGGGVGNIISGGAGLFGGGGSILSALSSDATTGGLLTPGVAAFLSSPITLGVGALLAFAGSKNFFSDPDGFKRTNSGFFVAPTPGAQDDPSRLFDIDPFASGFQGQGFNRRGSIADANLVVDQFRAVDQLITDAVRSAGGSIDLSGATLAGLGQEGIEGTRGTFLGIGSGTVDLKNQLNFFAQQLADHINGLSTDIIVELRAAGTATEITSILERITEKSEATLAAAEAAVAEAASIAGAEAAAIIKAANEEAERASKFLRETALEDVIDIEADLIADRNSAERELELLRSSGIEGLGVRELALIQAREEAELRLQLIRESGLLQLAQISAGTFVAANDPVVATIPGTSTNQDIIDLQQVISLGFGKLSGPGIREFSTDVVALSRNLTEQGIFDLVEKFPQFRDDIVQKLIDFEKATGMTFQEGIISGALLGLVGPQQPIAGSFAHGLSRVPRDGFIVETHRNEEILAANDPRNINNPAAGRDGASELRKLNKNFDKLLSAVETMAISTNKTARALDEAVRKGDGALSVVIAA